MQKHSSLLWWQKEIVYQIYPRSFQDSNADGVGDLQGILSRLDYLQWLGIKAVWLSPIYPSPMADFGYDISDYVGIHPLFGTMDDFDILLKEVHARGMHLILDFVPNHTSDQHPWFLESRSSRTNPKRDWYIWKDAKSNGSEPNNWLAMFGGTGWEWDETTQQYYYHAFLKEQPDLNWRNPEVQEAMLGTLRFWLEKGVDGFRIDVLWHIIKDETFRNNPINGDYLAHQPTYNQLLPVYSTDQPEVHELVQRMRKLMDEFGNRMMIGEIYLPIQQLMTYYGTDNNGVHLPFNFQLLSLPWEPLKIAAAIAEYETALPRDAWPNWVLGNHDQARVASRLGRDQAKIAAMLLLTLRGTPTLYYGDEIGMKDVPIPLEEIRDPQGLNMPGKNLSRDPARTPMQWDSFAYSGFSTEKPWLRTDRNYAKVNVVQQKEDPHSQLHFIKDLIALRQTQSAFTEGEYVAVYADHQILSYLRKKEGADGYLVVLNLSHRNGYFTPLHEQYEGTIVLATCPELIGTHVSGPLVLAGDEGYVVRLDAQSGK